MLQWRPIQQYIQALLDGEKAAADNLVKGLKPLFGLVTVKTQEESPHGSVTCRARNPLAAKTLMHILGMPVGPCKPPLGKMTLNGINVVLEAARLAHKLDPEIFVPIAEFFKVDIEDRLSNEANWKDLYYLEY